MDIRKMVAFGCLLGCAMAYGQAKESFMQQQAYAEMQRVSGQVRPFSGCATNCA